MGYFIFLLSIEVCHSFATCIYLSRKMRIDAFCDVCDAYLCVSFSFCGYHSTKRTIDCDICPSYCSIIRALSIILSFKDGLKIRFQSNHSEWSSVFLLGCGFVILVLFILFLLYLLKSSYSCSSSSSSYRSYIFYYFSIGSFTPITLRMILGFLFPEYSVASKSVR